MITIYNNNNIVSFTPTFFSFWIFPYYMKMPNAKRQNKINGSLVLGAVISNQAAILANSDSLALWIIYPLLAYQAITFY